MAWVFLVLVLGGACVWVVGGSGRATRGWSLVGLWSWWCRLFPVLRRLVLWVVGGGAVLQLSVVLVTVLVRAPPAELWVMSKVRAL